MRRGDEVTASDMDALLAELQDVGGSVAGPGQHGGRSPVASASKPRGTAGSTSVLRAQLSSATRNNGANLLNRRSSSTGGRRGSLTALASTPHTALPQQQQVSGFSSYVPTGLTEAELRSERHTSTPLGLRLAPLPTTPEKRHGPPLSAAGGTPPLCPTPPARSGKPKDAKAPDASSRRASVTPGLGLGLGLAPLPSLGELPPAPASSTAPKRDFSFRHNYRQFIAEADAEDAKQPQQQTDGSGEGDYREANFLPIMCARYLNPAGLTPAPRWGHTLTALGGSSLSGSRLYMFGGMELHGGESNVLAQFDTSNIAWEPTLVLPPSGSDPTAAAAPAPRYSHAACAYEDRYIAVSGGAAKKASVVFADLHLFDTHTHQWRCVWEGGRGGGGRDRNAPGPRFGHSIVVRDDRLYLFGGKVLKASTPASTTGTGEKTATTAVAATADVFVFSLNSLRWKKRIRAAAVVDRGGKAKGSAEGRQDGVGPDAPSTASLPASPPPRAYHAATVKGSVMYINGGADAQGHVLSDTWQLDLAAATSGPKHGADSEKKGGRGDGGGWTCLHAGQSADAIPRERHELFACGEALLVVGGCSASMYSTAIAGKFNNLVSVLLTVGEAAGSCWIPVAMGNVSIVAPNKKNFAAAFIGGFVYVFGGMCGMEPATNTMIRFLAADGYVAADARATSLANDEAIRSQMRVLRERPPIPHDIVTVADLTYTSNGGRGAADEAMDLASEGLFAEPLATREVKFHKCILAQRAPLLLAALQACRSESATVALSSSTAATHAHRRSSLSRGSTAGGGTTAGAAKPIGEKAPEEHGDVVDALLQQQHRALDGSSSAHAAGGSSGSVAAAGQITTYYTAGNSRVAGLPHALSAEEMSCLADYIYRGGLPAGFKRLLRDETSEEESGKDADNVYEGDENTRARAEAATASRQRLRQILLTLKQAAEDYQLPQLGALGDALLSGSRRQLQQAQEQSCATLRCDMKAMLDSGSGATCTVLFIDPHTNQQSAHALHPSVLMTASRFFLELLRPLYTGERATFQVGSVAAKITAAAGGGKEKGSQGMPPAAAGAAGAAALSTSSSSTPHTLLFSSGASSISKRAVLIGPVAVPKLAVPPILSYLYTQKLEVPRQLAFEVMLGAHQLGLPLLQSYCEAIVAREEVNYDSCCSFYFVAKKYSAALLEETSLLTAVSGFAAVRHNAGYQNLSEQDRQSIDALAAELGSAAWVPPPQPTHEMKSGDVYAARWHAASMLP